MVYGKSKHYTIFTRISHTNAPLAHARTDHNHERKQWNCRKLCLLSSSRTTHHRNEYQIMRKLVVPNIPVRFICPTSSKRTMTFSSRSFIRMFIIIVITIFIHALWSSVSRVFFLFLFSIFFFTESSLKVRAVCNTIDGRIQDITELCIFVLTITHAHTHTHVRTRGRSDAHTRRTYQIHKPWQKIPIHLWALLGHGAASTAA